MKKTIDNKLFHNGVLKVKKSKEEHLLESLYEKRSGFKTVSF